MIWLTLGVLCAWLATLWWARRTHTALKHELRYLQQRTTSQPPVETFPMLFRTLAQALDAGVVVIDAKRTICYCNETAADMFGVTVAEALNHGIITLLRDYQADLMITQSIQRAELQQMTLSPILSNRTIRLWSEPHIGTGGALLIARDLTKLSQLERARRDLVANVSHELRTPLTSIQLLIETLQTHPPQSIAQRMLGQVHTELDAVMNLVDDLHELSRIESGRLALQFSLTPIATLIEQALVRIQPQADQKHIDLQTEIEADLPALYVDRDRMSQVLLNLLQNAVKWTANEGQIVLKAQCVNHSAVKGALDSQLASDHWILLSVTDTGAGIPAADLGRIFERFYKVDRARTRMKGGSGLGLAIVKHLVEGHKGIVWATSVEGHGSTFVVALPMLD